MKEMKEIINGRGRGNINRREARGFNIRGSRCNNRGRGKRIYQRRNNRNFLENSSQSNEDLGGSVYNGESYDNSSYERFKNSFNSFYSDDL